MSLESGLISINRTGKISRRLGAEATQFLKANHQHDEELTQTSDQGKIGRDPDHPTSNCIHSSQRQAVPNPSHHQPANPRADVQLGWALPISKHSAPGPTCPKEAGQHSTHLAAEAIDAPEPTLQDSKASTASKRSNGVMDQAEAPWQTHQTRAQLDPIHDGLYRVKTTIQDHFFDPILFHPKQQSVASTHRLRTTREVPNPKLLRQKVQNKSHQCWIKKSPSFRRRLVICVERCCGEE